MANAGKFLNPIKKSISLLCSRHSSPISQSRQLVHREFDSVTTLIKRLRPSLTQHNKFLSLRTFGTLNSAVRRASLAIGIAGGASIVIGSVTFSPAVAYAMDGVDILMDDDREPFDASDRDEFAHAAWMVIRKLWLPVFFVLTIVSNWNHPIVLFTKGVLLLLATRPSPLTVYLFVEQLCNQSKRQEPHSFWAKSLYARKVEVQDYKFLCIATVEVRDRRFTLVGILGGWWVLPLSPQAFSSFWESALY
ncbi:unnamed protein product [Linum tenue]|uniref:Uncharacterized protein n=1 Tax=Linum tenue TaxID=586396 RepID=A0AAV0N978_9ROSI|nr:unnamed protein product [Linum tenue]